MCVYVSVCVFYHMQHCLLVWARRMVINDNNKNAWLPLCVCICLLYIVFKCNALNVVEEVAVADELLAAAKAGDVAAVSRLLQV